MNFDKKEISSYLDGVPFTIGQKFCPPRPVSLPFAMGYQLPADLMSKAYDFSLEGKVLAFCQAKDEAEQRMQEETEHRMKQEADRKAKEEAARKAMEMTVPEVSGGDGNHAMKPSTSLWNPDNILQPMSQHPISSANGTPHDGMEALKKINLSDFEIDTRSPFDYMELQTINDLEELSTVFEGLRQDQRVETVQSTEFTGSALENMDQSMSSVSKSISFPLVQNSNNCSFSNSDANMDTCHDEANVLGYSLPVSKSFSKASDGYLSYSSPSVSAEDLPVHERSKRNSLYSSSDKPAGYPANCQVPSFATFTGQTVSRANTEIPNADYNPLRSSKSISDLSDLIPSAEDRSYSLRSRTPPAKASELSCRDFDDSITFVKKPYDQNLNNCVSGQQQQRDLPDPYGELSNGDRHFVDSVTDMGFQRGQVSRTVKHLGADEKKVVELLCQIQALEESGYDKWEAEAALHLHDYDKNEAIKYLDLINQFQDLGFQKDAIKKALVQNKNDRDKVIDTLLS